MKQFAVKLSYPNGGIREVQIEAESEEEAGQKFFRRKGGAAMLGQGKVEVEITEKIDTPSAEDYTREILIGLCEDGMTAMRSWHDRDSYSAHSQLGVAYALLKCDVPFRIEKCDARVVWVEFYEIDGFNSHEYGNEDGEDHRETETAYIPTRYHIEEAEGGDWY